MPSQVTTSIPTSLDYKMNLLSGSVTQLLLNIHFFKSPNFFLSEALVGKYQDLMGCTTANPDGL